MTWITIRRFGGLGATYFRALLNAFARSVHAVHSNNVVIAGGLAPFRDITPSILSQNDDWGPAAFLRTVLCLSKSLQPGAAPFAASLRDRNNPAGSW